MSITLTPIDSVDNISREDFVNNYLNARKPLIIRKATESWPALQKWTFDYLKETVGDITVPLYNSAKADPSKAINASASEMKFGDYIDLIQKQPTDLRIFLFDPIKHAPKLLEDYRSPSDLMSGFLDKYPNMFFGGAGSVTFLHYDIDLAHIFHTHFNGRKHVMLFDQKWSERLYCIPFATYALEDYDIANPDFSKFPALDGIEGQEAILEHGDTLFMPTGYWHLTIQRKFDNMMKARFKKDYMDWKENLAIKRANNALAAGKP